MMDAKAIAQAKARTRRAVDQALARLTPSRRRAAGISLAQRLAQVPSVRDARTLMVFLSLPTEIDTWPIIRWAWREHKRVAVPRIEPPPPGRDVPLSERRMVAVLLPAADVESLAVHPALRPGPLGILDVADPAPLPVGELDVVLVPCQAVDRAGRRLGKGGGFFDRFLGDPALRADVIVIAFREQVLDEVPVAPWDRPVPLVVTDAEVLRPASPPAAEA